MVGSSPVLRLLKQILVNYHFIAPFVQLYNWCGSINEDVGMQSVRQIKMFNKNKQRKTEKYTRLTFTV